MIEKDLEGFKRVKKGLKWDKTTKEAKNWRPVTILSSLSKVVERVINSQLKKHLLKNKLISSEQYAYQKGKGTTSAWLELDTLTCAGLDQGFLVAYQLQDMSAAFNLVDKAVLV